MVRHTERSGLRNTSGSEIPTLLFLNICFIKGAYGLSVHLIARQKRVADPSGLRAIARLAGTVTPAEHHLFRLYTGVYVYTHQSPSNLMEKPACALDTVVL